ncbi:MAG TPA: hypothetical protein VGI68_03435 [Mycobacterium sp.]
MASQYDDEKRPGAQHAARQRLNEAETRLRRLQAAIEAGVEPTALVDAINEAYNTRAATRAELENTPAPTVMSRAEVYARLDSLEDIDTALSSASRERLANLYQGVDLQIRYEPSTQVAEASIQPVNRVNSECVRGGNRTPFRGTDAHCRCS